MYTLYYSPGVVSLAVQIKLQAIGEPYQQALIDLKKRQHLTEEFSRLNPRQLLPVLEFNGEYFSEAMALLLFLEQRHPQGLLPGEPNLLAKVLQKMSWLSNTLHTDFAALWRPIRFSNDDTVQQQLSSEAKKRLSGHFETIDKELQSAKFWLAGQLTLADYYLLPFLRWGNMAIPGMADLEATQRYLAAMAELPEVKAALALEGISLQLAL